MQKKGFTLVELSIVLVIIGLLIGGILAAQSMIQTAKIQSFIRQVGQFDAAVENFQTKYNGLPGDSSSLGCGNSSGNGAQPIAGPQPIPMPILGPQPQPSPAVNTNTCDNAQINSSDNGNYGDGNGFQDGGEIGDFWYDLSQSGLTNPNGAGYTSCAGGSNGSNCLPTPGIDIPKSVFSNQEGWIAAYWTCDGCKSGASSLPAQNYYSAGNFWDSGDDGEMDDADSSIKPSQMLAIDTKIDDAKDGDFGSNVFAYDATQASTGNPYPNSCDDGTGKYDVANDSTARCFPFIRIGISTGDLK